MIYTGSNLDVAQFAVDTLQALGKNFLSITITARGASEVCYVSIVTDTSLEDTVEILARSYSLQRIDISPPNTQAG